MYRIGEFSKVNSVSIKTLHYYDELGLLTPIKVDKSTGYRYYGAEQILKLNQILAFKEAGCSLTEILEILKGDKPNKEIIRILEDKADGVDEALRTEQERIQRLRTNIFLLKNGGIPMENNVTIKIIEPILVAALSKKIYAFDDMGPLWETLNHEIDLKKGKKSLPCMTLYHDGFDASKGITVEVIEPLSKPIEGTNAMKVYELPAHSKVACIVHIGSFDTINL
ncbi:MerR family transcriptional regulator [Fusibacter sp. 3D3]|uniref:MerR family transcriptional regulator n=1 Tax=Fusibacter sp. 3D3 TaxID=1048380 RepID=UPI000857C20D|nr:MerR family transcriptional regulator [Fusibacter sp. 3D3]GAU75856.1 transcriptional regulator [Fusibacter sp. 3D3]